MTGTNRPIIIVDIDGVLADYVYGFSLLANLHGKFPDFYPTGGQENWDWGLSPAAADELYSHIFKGPGFWTLLKPLITDQEIEHFNHFIESNDVDLLYVTNRVGTGVEWATSAWLQKYGFPISDIIFTADKVGYLKEYKDRIIAVIEDSPANILYYQYANMPVFIRDWPYNRHVEGDRVGSLTEFILRAKQILLRGSST